MLEFDAPRVESLRATPRDTGKRRFVLVTMRLRKLDEAEAVAAVIAIADLDEHIIRK